LLASSCTKGDFDFNKLAANQWDPEFAVPLVNSTVSLKDINLPANCYLQVEADNSQSIVYTGSLITVKTTDFITQLNSIPVNTSYTLSATDIAAFLLVPIGTSYTSSASQVIDLSAQTTNGSGMDLDSAVLKSGELKLQIQNTFSHTANITISIPAIKKPVSASVILLF